MDYHEALEMFERDVFDLAKKGHWSMAERYQCAVDAMKELQKYKQIGTLEEVRAAVGKLSAKKVIDDGAFGRCPVCDYEFNSELRNEYNITACPGCHQNLDWSE